MGDELRSQLHAIYSANFNDGEPVGERYGSKDTVHISQVIDFIDDFVIDFIQQEIAKARIDELKQLEALHTRTYRQTVTDHMGNIYVDDSRSYISKYETQERIATLEAELSATLKEHKEE